MYVEREVNTSDFAFLDVHRVFSGLRGPMVKSGLRICGSAGVRVLA